MTFEETRDILKLIKTGYPKYFQNFKVEQANDFLNLWSDLFAEDNSIVVATAVKSYIKTDAGGYPPVPGQITELMYKITHPNAIDADKAWQYISRALKDSSYYAQKEFDKLPKEVQLGVGSPDQLRTWASMRESEVQTVVMSLFKKGFDRRVKEMREFEMLPDQAKQMIQALEDAKRLD